MIMLARNTSASMGLRQAAVFTPLMLIVHDP
jgi:hypothetical protein